MGAGGDQRQIDEAAIKSVVKTMEDLIAQYRRVVEQVENLSGVMNTHGDLSSVSLAILKDRAGRMETNVATLQSSVDLVSDRISSSVAQEHDILGTVIGTLLDVDDSVTTLKEALVGLTQQIQADRSDSSCVWRQYLDPEDAAKVFMNLATISSLAEKLSVIVHEGLGDRGYDPQTGKKREWLNIQIDRLRQSMGAVLLNLIATSIIGGVVWLWVGSKAAAESAQVKAYQLQLQQAEERAQHMQDVIRGLEATNLQLKAGQPSRKPRTPERTAIIPE